MKNTKFDEMAAYLFHQGTNFESYRYLGFHILQGPGKKSEAVFRVWAPNAKSIFLTGDFNGWDNSLPMERITDGGVFEVRLDAKKVSHGDNYKFKIETRDGRTLYKADPYAFYAEKPPLTASRICLEGTFEWTDGGYLENRKKNFYYARVYAN